MLLSLSVYAAQAQAVVYELQLESLSSNRKTYYYGEPINLHFLQYATIVGENDRRGALAGGSFRIELISLGAPIIFSPARLMIPEGISEKRWGPGLAMDVADRKRIRLQSYLVNSEFVPAIQITGRYCSPFMLDLYSTVLPVGRYEFRVIYISLPLHPLLPVSQEIVSKHAFEIVPVPASENEAFRSYQQAMGYACANYPASGDQSYVVDHPKGLQSFIEKYPASRYAQYAMYVAADWVYGYMPGDKRAADLIDQFLLGDQLTLAELKAERAKRINVFIRDLTDTIEQQKIFDHTLKSIQGANPLLSEMVLELAKSTYGFNNLRNYALEKQGD